MKQDYIAQLSCVLAVSLRGISAQNVCDTAKKDCYTNMIDFNTLAETETNSGCEAIQLFYDVKIADSLNCFLERYALCHEKDAFKSAVGQVTPLLLPCDSEFFDMVGCEEQCETLQDLKKAVTESQAGCISKYNACTALGSTEPFLEWDYDNVCDAVYWMDDENTTQVFECLIAEDVVEECQSYSLAARLVRYMVDHVSRFTEKCPSSFCENSCTTKRDVMNSFVKAYSNEWEEVCKNKLSECGTPSKVSGPDICTTFDSVYMDKVACIYSPDVEFSCSGLEEYASLKQGIEDDLSSAQCPDDCKDDCFSNLDKSYDLFGFSECEKSIQHCSKRYDSSLVNDATSTVVNDKLLCQGFQALYETQFQNLLTCYKTAEADHGCNVDTQKASISELKQYAEPSICPSECSSECSEFVGIADAFLSTVAPSESPSVTPTGVPSGSPSEAPTQSPTNITEFTEAPTVSPINDPEFTEAPTSSNTEFTESPTVSPINDPDFTEAPTVSPGIEDDECLDQIRSCRDEVSFDDKENLNFHLANGEICNYVETFVTGGELDAFRCVASNVTKSICEDDGALESAKLDGMLVINDIGDCPNECTEACNSLVAELYDILDLDEPTSGVPTTAPTTSGVPTTAPTTKAPVGSIDPSDVDCETAYENCVSLVDVYDPEVVMSLLVQNSYCKFVDIMDAAGQSGFVSCINDRKVHECVEAGTVLMLTLLSEVSKDKCSNLDCETQCLNYIDGAVAFMDQYNAQTDSPSEDGGKDGSSASRIFISIPVTFMAIGMTRL